MRLRYRIITVASNNVDNVDTSLADLLLAPVLSWLVDPSQLLARRIVDTARASPPTTSAWQRQQLELWSVVDILAGLGRSQGGVLFAGGCHSGPSLSLSLVNVRRSLIDSFTDEHLPVSTLLLPLLFLISSIFEQAVAALINIPFVPAQPHTYTCRFRKGSCFGICRVWGLARAISPVG